MLNWLMTNLGYMRWNELTDSLASVSLTDTNISYLRQRERLNIPKDSCKWLFSQANVMTDLVLIFVIQDLKSHDQYEVPDSFSESDKCKDKLLKQNLDKLRGRNLNI